MKRNEGYFYKTYKEWKVQLDVVAPIILAVLGMLVGYYVKRKLFFLGIDESVSSSAMAALTAAPIAIYNRTINNYAAKIQEDKDCDDIEAKNKSISIKRREIQRLKKEIERLKNQKISTYQAHKKVAEKIQKRLNKSDVEHTLRNNICEMLYAGDGDIFSLTISSQQADINDISTTDNGKGGSAKKYNSESPITPEDIN